MADENKSSDPGSKPPPPDKGQDRVDLSIKEGMLVMPATPDPEGHTQIGGLPTSEGGSEGGEGGGGGGSEGGGGSSSSSDSGE